MLFKSKQQLKNVGSSKDKKYGPSKKVADEMLSSKSEKKKLIRGASK